MEEEGEGQEDRMEVNELTDEPQQAQEGEKKKKRKKETKDKRKKDGKSLNEGDTCTGLCGNVRCVVID